MIPQAVNSRDSAFREYSGLFLHALSQLSQRGLPVPPDQAMDLIQDFLLEEWDGVHERFNPNAAIGASKRVATFHTYLYRAFLYYARPRLIDGLRWRQSLIDIRELADRVADTSASVAGEETLDSDSLVGPAKDALHQLPEPGRGMLVEFLAHRTTERQLAQELGLSRHAARTLLITTLGRWINQLRKFDQSNTEWKVAECIWNDGFTTRQTAEVLGISEPEVKAQQAKNHVFVLKCLKLARKSQGMALGNMAMSETMRSLLERIVRNPQDPKVLEDTKRHAVDFVAFLDKLDPRDPLAKAIDAAWAANPESISRIYELLSHGLGVRIDEGESKEVFTGLYAKDRQALGECFKNALLKGVPPDKGLDGLLQLLRPVSSVEAHFQSVLREDPDVQGGMKEALALVPYGVTPRMIFNAIDIITALIERVRHRKIIPRESLLVMSPTLGLTDEKHSSRVDPNVMIDEIERATDCDPAVAKALLEWPMQLARFKPYVYVGFKAKPYREDGVCLKEDGKAFDSLFERWQTIEAETTKLIRVAAASR